MGQFYSFVLFIFFLESANRKLNFVKAINTNLLVTGSFQTFIVIHLKKGFTKGNIQFLHQFFKKFT